jgi:ubiquinone/menaquinone biosynthesis C-methylase UbiE
MKYHAHANDPERRTWQNPEAILADIGVKAGLTFVDVGCGGGFFALPAARMIGQSGRVYGLDANADFIRELRELAYKENLNNLELTVGRAEDEVLCRLCADIVFFGTALHDFDDPTKVLANARKMLSGAGQLVNLDWKKVPMKLGPPLEKRFSEETATRLILSAGFTLVGIKDISSYHYMITAKP